MSHPIRIESAGRTRSGQLHPTHDDAFTILDYAALFLVCSAGDESAAGRLASQMAVDVMIEAFRDVTWPAGDEPPAKSDLTLLVDAIGRANARIHAAAQTDSLEKGMSTSLVAVLADASTLHLARAGDGEVHLFRDGLLHRLTAYGSVAGERIARALGVEPAVVVDTATRPVLPGDLVLVCNGGLSRAIDEREIAEILISHREVHSASARLVECAKDKGGPDAVTAVLVRWTER